MMIGGGGSPVKPLVADAGSNTQLQGMDGVVVNESLLELAASGQCDSQVHFYSEIFCWWFVCRQPIFL